MTNKERFLPVDAEFATRLNALLIVDYSWWYQNDYEVTAWCKNTMADGYDRRGMVISFASVEDRLQFLLRWGS